MMEKGKRRKLMNLIGDKLKRKLYFKRVEMESPAETPPSTLDMPCLFVMRTPEDPVPMTAKRKETEFGFEVIAFVMSDKDLALVKCDVQDEIEESLMELQIEDAFTDLATLINVTRIDPTPVSLVSLGITNPIHPPIGVVRISCNTLFHYQAID